MFLIVNSSTSMFLASAFDSAFFNKRRMKRTDFSGQRPGSNEHKDCLDQRLNAPFVVLNCFACDARPMPPAKRRKGMICLCSVTSPRYLYAFWSFKPESRLSAFPSYPISIYDAPVKAAATSRMFLKCVRRYSPRAFEAEAHDQSFVLLHSMIAQKRTLFGVSGKSGAGVANCPWS